ncbi:MAG: ATP-binding protein [Oscillospiraceae bacterium]|nr:ATP-binding protein [Oscillospiraceae bacterium]
MAVRKRIIKLLESIDFDNDSPETYDNLAPFVKKITNQKKALRHEIEIQKNRADTIEKITENMKAGLVMIDRSYKVLSANKSAFDIFGADLLGKNLLHICRDTEFQSGLKSCFAGDESESSLSKDGKVYNVFCRAANDIGIILLVDHTVRYEAEKLRREFSANVSHELMTPLTTISALAEMIGNGMARGEDIVGFASKISAQSKRLIEIIDDIIKISKFDENRFEKEYSEFELNKLALTIIEALRLKAEEKNVSLNLESEKIKLRANKRMIDELLYNLIDNAIKYNKDGGSVSVSLDSTGGFCSITVADTGIGIPHKHLNRVFERFYRVDKSRSKETGGTGLGLSIVKHIVEYHGGNVSIKSGKDGTSITALLANE